MENPYCHKISHLVPLSPQTKIETRSTDTRVYSNKATVASTLD